MTEREPPEDEPNEAGGPGKPGRMRLLGIVLLAIAVLMWVAAPATLLIPLSTTQRVWTTSALLIVGEVAFWAAAVVLGREVVRRYRSLLDPRRLFGKKRR